MKLSREEMVELAGRDALGMLDPDELEAFERDFRRADAALRQELREVQEEVAALSVLLSQPEPEQELREHTLARIDACIEQVPAPTLKRRVLGTIERFIEDDLQDSLQFPGAGVPVLPAPREWVERFAAGRVSPMWRFAAVILIATSILLGWFGLDAYSSAMRIAELQSQNHTEEIIRIWFGQAPEDFWFNPEARVTPFTVAKQDFKGRAMLSVINSQDRGFLAAINLPASSDPYRLKMGFDTPENARTIAEFYSRDGTCGVPISLGGAMDVSGAKWWVMGPSATGEGTETALLMITP